MHSASRNVTLQEVSTEAPELPTSIDLKTAFTGGLFILALFAALRIAGEIAIPFMLALILKFVFHPIIRRCEAKKISRKFVSICLVMLLLGSLVGIGSSLSDPAAAWAAKIQDNYPQIRQRIDFLRTPVVKTQKLLAQADTMTQATIGPIQPSKKIVAVVEGQRFSDRVIDTLQSAASGLVATLIILLFMLTTGDTFLRRFVEILPRFKDKRQAVDISYEIERDISRYLLTITIMNAFVGLAAGLIMFFCHVENPAMWGALAFLLNYIPVIGPFMGIGLFFMVGIISSDNTIYAFAPAVLYFLVHIAEGTFITPMVLAKRFTLNPVLIICSLIFWYWMWGIVGAVIAMPMLAMLKITCDRIERLSGFGHLLEA